jgi:hypothetical protein
MWKLVACEPYDMWDDKEEIGNCFWFGYSFVCTWKLNSTMHKDTLVEENDLREWFAPKK